VKRGIILFILIMIIIVAIVFFLNIKNDSEEIDKDQSALEIRQATVGFIGCSNTHQTVYGYRWAQGKNIWLVERNSIHDYDSGSVVQWARDIEEENQFWNVFDEHLKRNPNTHEVWWQLCIPLGESRITYEEALIVIENLRNKISGVKIYVSPLAEYTESVCEITGIEGIERAISLAKELDSKNDDVLPGPILGPLSLSEISHEERDRCHPNEEGMGKMGGQLKEFFG